MPKRAKHLSLYSDFIVKRPLESPRPVRVCLHDFMYPRLGFAAYIPQFDLRYASTPESVHEEIEKDHRYEWLRH